MKLLSDTDILAEFEAAHAILRGHFILSSGLHSDTYLQCARVLMQPKRAEKLCAALAEKIKQQLPFQEFDLVVAPAMGGVVVGYEMARQMNLEGLFCERQDGVFTLRRGFNIEAGARVLVVEDVVTTGKSSLEAYKCIEEAGGIVVAEASLIDRSNGSAHATLGVPYISLMTLEVPTFQPDALPEHLQNIPAIKPGSRWLAATAKTA